VQTYRITVWFIRQVLPGETLTSHANRGADTSHVRLDLATSKISQQIKIPTRNMANFRRRNFDGITSCRRILKELRIDFRFRQKRPGTFLTGFRSAL